MSDKATGSFYTPQKLVDFMIAYINRKISYNTILEPSAGDGIFLKTLSCSNKSIDAIELDENKVSYINGLGYRNTNCYHSDFLEYESIKKYDLIIGNPPYINKKSFSEKQTQLGDDLSTKFNLNKSICTNLWVCFVLKSLEYINAKGTIFFVLPYEFLQVNYATSLRSFLESKFKYIDIIVFNEKTFPSTDQDTCLVLLSNSLFFQDKEINPYISLKVYEEINIQSEPIYEGKIERNKPIMKWSNSILTDSELEFLNEICSRFHRGNQLFTSVPGIVTAANKFFILNKDEVSKYKANDLVKKIISKSSDIGNKLIFSDEDFTDIIRKNKKGFLLYLSELEDEEISIEVQKYLRDGEKQEINERYKCTKRKRWYDTRLGERGKLVFFKRYHIYPRLVINETDAYTTDIGYNITMNEGLDSNVLAFNFYNSLTIAMCEYNGRFYGGGVCELTPLEFKNLPIPMEIITEADILKLDQMIRNGYSIEEITEFVDSKTLKKHLSEKEILKLVDIKIKLIRRRLSNYLK